MRSFSKTALSKTVCAIAVAGLLMGCVVREEPRRRVVVVHDAPPTEVVYTDTPPAYVDEVTVAPGPEYIWVAGGYVREGDHWRLHRGYWRHR